MDNIIINAILKSKEGKADELKAILMSVMEPSRNEEGCIEYNLHTSLEDTNVFVFYEIWKNEETLQKHINSPHYKAYRNAVGGLLESREVFRLNKLK